MGLELKHIAPHLPYGLTFRYDSEPSEYTLLGLQSDKMKLSEVTEDLEDDWVGHNDGWKPVLRPLSDLTKEVVIDNVKCVPIKKLGTRFSSISCMLYSNTVQLDVSDSDSINMLYYLTVFEKLYSMHFDVSGLIDKGLAININDLQ